MDDQGRKQQAPQQYSADGRWWWDGHRWVAVQQQPRPAGPGTPPGRRGVPILVWVAVGAVVLLMGVCTVAVATSPSFQQGAKAGARAAVATSSPAPRRTPTPQATPVDVATVPAATRKPPTTPASAGGATPAAAPASDGMTGFGALDSAWNANHRASTDTRLTPGCCYNADPSLPQVNGHVGYRYYAVLHMNGRVLQYEIAEYSSTSITEARAETLRGEFPTDAQILWGPTTKDSCAQMEVQSATLGHALSDPKVGDSSGRVLVEFMTGNGYEPNNITDVLLMLGDYASSGEAPGC